MKHFLHKVDDRGEELWILYGESKFLSPIAILSRNEVDILIKTTVGQIEEDEKE